MVDGGQLFVDGLQLLAARLQFFGGGTQLLVDGLQFFVAGLELFGRCLVLLDGVAQVGFEALNLAVELVCHRVGTGAHPALGRGCCRLRIRPRCIEQHQQQAGRSVCHGAHLQPQPELLARQVKCCRQDVSRLARMGRLVQRRPQLDAHRWVDQLEQVARGLAPGERQEPARQGRHVQDLVLGIHHQRWRRQLLQELQMQFGPVDHATAYLERGARWLERRAHAGCRGNHRPRAGRGLCIQRQGQRLRPGHRQRHDRTQYVLAAEQPVLLVHHIKVLASVID